MDARSNVGDVRRGAAGPDDLGNRSDVSSGHGDVPGIQKGMDTTEDTREPISHVKMPPQTQNVPVKVGDATRSSPEAVWECQSCTDTQH